MPVPGVAEICGLHQFAGYPSLHVIQGPPYVPDDSEISVAPRRLSIGRARPLAVATAEAIESSVDLLREFERTGRPEPFETFMRRHASMVYATCLKVTRDPHDAEDATQATFLTLASKSRLNGEIRQPEAWLRKVAHRLSLDLIRSKKRRVNRENVRSEMNDEAAPLDSHDHAHKGEVKGILNEELAKLPASYRMPLILHYFGGLSRDEMAAQLKLKPSTLGVRLHRAREQLRRKLAARGILLPTVALTALLTEVVRGSVCGHLMSNTARQASAIVLGHASLPMVASPLFAASTGVDSIGSLLSMLSHGKLKVLLSLALLGSAISMSSAQVRMLLPEAIRSWLPALRMPSMSLPRMDLLSPRPMLSAVTSSSTTQRPTVSDQTARFSGLATRSALVTSLSATLNAAEQLATAIGSDRIAHVPATVPHDVDAMRGVASLATHSVAGTCGSNTAFPFGTRGSSSSVFAANNVHPAPLFASTPEPGHGEPHATQQSAAPSSDSWNSVIAVASAAGLESAGSSGIDLGSGGGGGGGGVPSHMYDNLPTPAAIPNNLPRRLTAPVTGGVPTLQSTSGNRAGTADGSSGPRASAQSVSTDSNAAPVKDTNATSNLTPRTTARTIVFNGTSANLGGYSDASLKPTQLNHLPLDAMTSTTPSTPPGYSFNYPSVPGSTLSVNGARVTLHNANGIDEKSAAKISLVDTSTTAIPKLPDGHTFIGVWQLDVATPFTSADLLVRYDDLRAARLGLNERVLKLWVSDGNGWTLLWRDPTFGRDVNQNMMWVTANSDFKFFAASAPEPTTLAVAIGAVGLATRRRRR